MTFHLAVNEMGSVIDTLRHLSTIYVSAFLEALDLMVLANANKK